MGNKRTGQGIPRLVDHIGQCRDIPCRINDDNLPRTFRTHQIGKILHWSYLNLLND